MVLFVALEGVGICLVDAEPRELLYVSLSNLKIRASRTETQQSLEVHLAHLQVDAAVPTTKFPVMLAPLPQPLGVAERPNGGACLFLSIAHNRKWHHHSLVYLEYVGASVQPLRLQLEQNTTARLVRLFASLDKMQNSAKAVGSGAGAAAGSPESKEHSATAAGSGGGGSGGGGGGSLPASFLKFYIQELTLHQISLQVTVQIDLACDDHALQPFHPTQGLHALGGALRHLLSLQNVCITLDRYRRPRRHPPPVA